MTARGVVKRNDAPTLERLEKALAIVARAIVLDGAVYAPTFDRLEREIAALRADDDVVSRARRYLAARASADSSNKIIEGAS